MDIQDILILIQAMDEHSMTELRLDDGTMDLQLKREEKAPQILTVTGSGISESGAMPVAMPVAAAVSVAAPAAQESAPAIDSDKVIHSPLVGTFYNASSPEAEPFVKVGDSVKKGQVLGIIEAMKLMNEIECEFDGVVEAVLVGNEDVVEYGQPLFRIR